MIEVITGNSQVLVLTTSAGIEVLSESNPTAVQIGGTGSPGRPAKTGACLNFEGPFSDGKEMGGFISPGDDIYDAAHCRVRTPSPSADMSILVKREGQSFLTIHYTKSTDLWSFNFVDGVIALDDLIQFFAPATADPDFGATGIIYILLAGR